MATRKSEVRFYKQLVKALRAKGIGSVSPETAADQPVYCFSGPLIIDFHLRMQNSADEVAQVMIDKFLEVWPTVEEVGWFTVLNKEHDPLFGFGPIPRNAVPKAPAI